MARKMLEESIDIKIIEKVTGFKKEEIQKIKREDNINKCKKEWFIKRK